MFRILRERHAPASPSQNLEATEHTLDKLTRQIDAMSAFGGRRLGTTLGALLSSRINIIHDEALSRKLESDAKLLIRPKHLWYLVHINTSRI